MSDERARKMTHTKLACLWLIASGAIAACLEGPRFHHGAMIGVGAAMLAVDAGRKGDDDQ